MGDTTYTYFDIFYPDNNMLLPGFCIILISVCSGRARAVPGRNFWETGLRTYSGFRRLRARGFEGFGVQWNPRE